MQSGDEKQSHPSTPHVADPAVSSPPVPIEISPSQALPTQTEVPATNHPHHPSPDNGSSSSNGLATASMVLGIVGLLTCLIFGIGFILGIIAIVFAIIVLLRQKAGKAMAVAGLVTGILAVLGGFFALLIFLIAFASHSSETNTQLDTPSGASSVQYYTQ